MLESFKIASQCTVISSGVCPLVMLLTSVSCGAMLLAELAMAESVLSLGPVMDLKVCDPCEHSQDQCI